MAEIFSNAVKEKVIDIETLEVPPNRHGEREISLKTHHSKYVQNMK